jgi:predicted transcriptional regulator
VIIKPLKGIENCKFQPIIKSVDDVHVNLERLHFASAGQTALNLLKEIVPYALRSEADSHRSRSISNSKLVTVRPSDTVRNRDRHSAKGSRLPNSKGSKPIASINSKSASDQGKVSRGKMKKISMFDGVIQKFCE